MADNGSDDGTPDEVRRRYPGVDVLALDRNALWSLWLRRPALPALRSSLLLMREARHDSATVDAAAAALRGLPWVLRERWVVTPRLERELRRLELARAHRSTRLYR